MNKKNEDDNLSWMFWTTERTLVSNPYRKWVIDEPLKQDWKQTGGNMVPKGNMSEKGKINLQELPRKITENSGQYL
ncbi:Titin [Manis pentadactyla]|nr:Titin [Manis pentadactyla]